MTEHHYRARKCSAPGCGLRFPVAHGSPLGRRCPRCGASTEAVDAPYPTHGVDDRDAPVGGADIEVLVDNVRSLRNVGSMFRTADAAGVRHMHLGGFTPTPDHPRLAKTALGAEAAVPWTHHRDAAIAAATLAASGACLWALEGGPDSVSLFSAVGPPTDRTLVVVVGHEVSGIDPRIVRICERVVHLPMHGVKTSLNVSVALGIALYRLRFS